MQYYSTCGRHHHLAFCPILTSGVFKLSHRQPSLCSNCPQTEPSIAFSFLYRSSLALVCQFASLTSLLTCSLAHRSFTFLPITAAAARRSSENQVLDHCLSNCFLFTSLSHIETRHSLIMSCAVGLRGTQPLSSRVGPFDENRSHQNRQKDQNLN